MLPGANNCVYVCLCVCKQNPHCRYCFEPSFEVMMDRKLMAFIFWQNKSKTKARCHDARQKQFARHSNTGVKLNLYIFSALHRSKGFVPKLKNRRKKPASNSTDFARPSIVARCHHDTTIRGCFFYRFCCAKLLWRIRFSNPISCPTLFGFALYKGSGK